MDTGLFSQQRRSVYVSGSWLCCAFCLMIWQVWAHEQSWSEQTYLHVRHTLTCNDTTGNITLDNIDRGVWIKLVSEDELMTDADYEVSSNGFSLIIRNVTDRMFGIYICEVLDKDGQIVFRSVKGVNIDGHLYHDLLSEYHTSIIRGVITTSCVVGLVVGIGLVDRFKYRTDQEKGRSRSSNRLRLSQLDLSDNAGMVHDLNTIDPVSYGAKKIAEGSTRF